MSQRKLTACVLALIMGLGFPLLSYASFIETTMGTAVVNDATAAYFNPAALVLVKNPQIIPLVTAARFRTEFTGLSTAVPVHITRSGTSSAISHYYSPSLYVAIPLNYGFTVGVAAVSNFANRDAEQNSILRYVQSSNTIQDYDVVPAFGLKINDHFSLGAGVNFSYVNFHLRPIIGFPGSNIADSQNSNQSDGTGVGGNVGLLLRPAHGTLIGFDYRTITTYRENGTSTFNGATQIVSDRYHFRLHTPARSVLTIGQAITPNWGFITTVQRIQWSIVRNINIYGIAAAAGSTPVITNASVPYHLHDTWVVTLGGSYQCKPSWIVRVAGTYNPSPSNGHYQVSTGNSVILGASLGYQVNKRIILDGSYAHAFIQNERINLNGRRFLVVGNNKAARDVVSLKLTINV